MHVVLADIPNGLARKVKKAIDLRPRCSSIIDRGVFLGEEDHHHPVGNLLIPTSEIFEGEQKFGFPQQNWGFHFLTFEAHNLSVLT